MDGGRKSQHRDQHRTDRDTDLTPTQRRTHAQAAVIHIRYHGSAPSPARDCANARVVTANGARGTYS